MASIVSGGGVPLCSFARFSVGHHMLDLDSSYGFGRQNFRPARGAHMFILLGQLPVSHAELLSTMGSTEDVSILNCCADKAHAIRTLIFKQSLVGLGFVCMLDARGRRTRWQSRRVGTRFRLSRSLGCRGCRRLALLGSPAHLQCDLASDFVQDFFLAHFPAAACQPVGSARCRTCEDSVAETYIAHLRAVLPGCSSSREYVELFFRARLAASLASPTPAGLCRACPANAPTRCPCFPRGPREVCGHFALFAAGTRFAYFTGEADTVQTALPVTLVGWKAILWEPELAYAALVWLPGRPVSANAFAAHAGGVLALPLPHCERVLVLAFVAVAAKSFFSIFCSQSFPVHRIAPQDL